MHVIVCLDEQSGMMFNGRRQSRDRKVTEDILNMTGGHLWTNEYSKELFTGSSIQVDDQPLEKAKAGTYCLIENQNLKPYEEKIESVTVYRWNRRYPADRRLDIDLENWRLESQVEFEGFSHERITKEVYRR